LLLLVELQKRRALLHTPGLYMTPGTFVEDNLTVIGFIKPIDYVTLM
jgi:hypothetical protein